jgi:hypothetical protein
MIYKLRRKGTGLFTGGTQGGGKDSCSGGVIGTDIHVFAGTDNSSVFNSHFKSTDGGKSFTALANAPWAARNECGYASVGGTIYMWGGKAGSVFSDSWKYTNVGGWQQISSSMTGFGGAMIFAFCYGDGYFYTIGGGLSVTLRSADLITWETRGALPLAIAGVSMATACYFKGAIYLCGGNMNSTKMYKSTDGGLTWAIVADNAIFNYLWCNLSACDNVMMYTKGTTGSQNQYGSYLSQDGVNWTKLSYCHEPTHAPTSFASSDNTKIYMAQGNGFQGSCWELSRIDVLM